MSSPSSSKKSGRRGPSSPPRALQITLKDLPTSKDDFDRASASLHSSTYKEAFRADYDVHFDSPINQTQIALVGTKVVGGVYCKLMQPPAGNTSVYIMCLSVSRSFLLDGIDTILLNHVLHVTTNEPIHEIFTHVRVDDQDRLTFFLNHGFLKIEHVPEEYAGIHSSRCYLLRWTKEERANLAEVAPHQTQDLASLSEVESCSKETANPAEEAPDNSEGPLDLPAVADMAISPKGTGMVIIEVEHEVIGSFENISGYRTGSQRFEQQATSREVLVRTFGHSMEAYFTLRESFIHTNIQRMYALTSTRKAKFLISCECIYGNLDTFLQSSKNDLCVSSKKKPPMHKDQFRNNWDQLIMHFMKQIRSGLLYLYDKKICHGRLTLKDVGLSFDHKFRSDQIEHIVVKLTLPEHEDSPHDPYIVGSKDMDRQSLGQILLSLIRAHPVHNPELRFMADSLIGTANFTLNDLERTPAMWSLAAKMDCISIVAYGRLQSRNFSQLYWTRHYKHLIDPAKREFAHLGIRAPRDYDDSLGDSIIFHRHVLLHYHQFRPAAKLMFGSDKGDVIRRFQNFYASAFVDIYKAMSPEQLKQLMAGMTLG